MQKRFTTQPPPFVHSAAFDHPILHGLDEAEAVIDWSELERLMSSIYGSKTGRLSERYMVRVSVIDPPQATRTRTPALVNVVAASSSSSA